MKHISLLIPEGETSLSNIEATYKMFSKVNEALESRGQSPLFKIQLVGLSNKACMPNSMFTIKPEVRIQDIEDTSLIIIPAVHGDMPTVVKRNRDFIPWIIEQKRKGSEVVSLCIGAFILAATGLLNGKNCTTHWLAADEFRNMYPDVNLKSTKIITDEEGIYTSGGAYSSLNLILYIVEKYAGREMALLSSKVFEIDIGRNSQSPFIIFNGQKEHEDESIKKAQLFIENNFREKITVDQMATLLAMGRRNLERRFKRATSNTTIEYIQRVRIEAAKKDLEIGIRNVNEVMYEVGYSDTKAFRSVFKKLTGLSPVEYRNKYNKEVLEA